MDSSIAIKWIRADEQDSEIARKLLVDHKTQNEKVIVPRLLYYEVANALTTKSDITTQTLKKGLKVLLNAELSNYSEDNETIVQAATLAKRYQTSVYDMLYAVIAKKKKCKLITADEKFVSKTKFKFVKLLKDLKRNNTERN